MWIAPSLVFWSSLGYLTYTYAGYPLLVRALARLHPQPPHPAPIEPTVSVVLAARNEEAHIRTKLDNLLSLDYPRDKLQVVVVSDGSTDGTESLVQRFGEPVELVSVPAGGKPRALNAGVAQARGEVVVLTDVRQRLAGDALRVAASFFADPRVGAVVGELQLESKKGPGAYWAYEKWIRAAEATLDSVVGGSGCFTAIRRHLFRPLPEDILLDDVWLPMQIVLAGYRVLYRPEIKVFDREASVSGEFARKARTLAGNFQLLEKMPELLDPTRNRLFLQFLSHKVLRLGCPFALLGLLGSNLALVLSGAPPWPLYAASLGAQLGGYALALHGALRGERAGRLSRLSHTFVTLNAAALEGLRRYASGDLRWTTQRHPVAA